MAEKKVKPVGLQVWAERLRGRSRMAVATIGGMFLAGFFFASRPLSDRIDAANLRYVHAESRMKLAADVTELRRLSAIYSKKLPNGIDLNDWTQYLLNGINAQRVRLGRMEPQDPLALGPCKVLTWIIDLDGYFESLSKVIEWFENGPRLIRIDRILFEGKHGRLTLSMMVRGLALDVPPEKLRAEKEKNDIDKAKAAKQAGTFADQHKAGKGKSPTEEKPVTPSDSTTLNPSDLTSTREGQP